MPLESGDAAPNFTLPGSEGEDITLSRFRGKQVVLYFYPKDDTPGCTKEALDFSCLVDKFMSKQAVVIGVSPDSMTKHEKFIKKHSLSVCLVSDEDHAIAEQYGVWVEKSMYGKKYMGIERSTFLIGADGRIKKAWRKVSVPGHAQEVLESLE